MKLIVVTGPTASGKSAFGMALAQTLNGVIINADSMQWYNDLPILTAQPTAEDRAVVPHYLYGTHSIHAQGSAAIWQENAIACLKSLEDKAEWVILVGGTGLYIKALTQGLSPVPVIPSTIRDEVRSLAAELSLDDFRDYVLQQDPELAQKNPPLEKQRLSRALEVKLTTGESIRFFQGKATPPYPFDLIQTVLIAPDSDALKANMMHRIHRMLDHNVLDEVENFWTKNPPTDCLLRQAIGLTSFTRYLHNEISKDEAIELTHIQTRQYAKRQLTWFRGQGDKTALVNPTADEVIGRINPL